MSDYIVETQALTKRYNGLTAVDGVDLRVRPGEIYGFLGPNGSGKTTTILMLLGLTEATSGWARVCGFDPLHEPLKVKRLVGYLPENVGFYADMTARENLRYTANLNRIPRQESEARIARLLDQVGLADAADRLVGQFSRGMRQRLGIADVLVKQPRVAFLDDPTMGLDPEGIQELLGMITHMSRELGVTIFLSSHLLQQVQQICDRVGIMFHGQMVVEGSMEELGRVGEEGLRVELQVDQATPALLETLRGVQGVQRAVASGSRITLQCTQDVRSGVAQAVLAQGRQLLQLRLADRTLEEVYLRYFRQAEAPDQAP